MKFTIIQFPDGTYGVRKRTLFGYRYASLITIRGGDNIAWWSIDYTIYPGLYSGDHEGLKIDIQKYPERRAKAIEDAKQQSIELKAEMKRKKLLRKEKDRIKYGKVVETIDIKN